MLGFVLFLVCLFIGSIIGSKVNKDGMNNKKEGATVFFSVLIGAMCIIILN